MKNCVFCQITANPKKRVKSIIFSNSDYLGMLVSHPETVGHFIVFPKKHYSNLSEMDNVSELCQLTIEKAEKVTKKLNAKAFTLKLNNKVYLLGNDSLHVGHVHIHIIPRYSQDDMNPNSPQTSQEDLLKIKNRIVEQQKLIP